MKPEGHLRTNRSMPTAVVIPELTVADIHAASSWLAAAFGFTPRLAIGNHRFQMDVAPGGSLVLVAAANRRPASLMFRVEDIGAHGGPARTAGATLIGEPMSYPYGERQYTAEDPDGHRWTFSQTLDDVDPSTWGGQLL